MIIARATERGRSESSDVPSLLFLIDDVVVDNGGNLSIYSGFGYMNGKRTSFGITQKLELNNAYVPGALFDIQFRMDVTGLLSRINEPGVGGSGSRLKVSSSRP